MNVTKGKKLKLKRLTVWNLDGNRDVVLAKGEQRVIKTGSYPTTTGELGVTQHPKYC